TINAGPSTSSGTCFISHAEAFAIDPHLILIQDPGQSEHPRLPSRVMVEVKTIDPRAHFLTRSPSHTLVLRLPPRHHERPKLRRHALDEGLGEEGLYDQCAEEVDPRGDAGAEDPPRRGIGRLAVFPDHEFVAGKLQVA